ncbi:PREDICTED: probable WRKY transcription factor 26 [Camelina sativa]|uniref:Probable WRKY transcription factor 26 n=1 Tax=Camelina sativa TaxID=90675 RepID=A0ABM0TAC9_CAMSA|nr:PREDICTED: probable WRKY transcription factor 26 [Camelina sativa]
MGSFDRQRVVPKFKSATPSPLPLSPSPFFTLPNGVSPADLLDSPILFTSSNILPSPTTGTFPAQSLNWKNNGLVIDQNDIKYEDGKNQLDFSFANKNTAPPLFLPSMVTQPLPQLDVSKSESLSSNKTSDDGYNWRKYGQKQVKGSHNHPKPPQSTKKSASTGVAAAHQSSSHDTGEDEADAKRWKREENVKEPRLVVQTTSDIDILEDGYRSN